MGIVVDFSIGRLPGFSLRARQPARMYNMPAKPAPGNPVIPATVAVDLRYESKRLVAAEGTQVFVEVSRRSETFWVYDKEMRDLIYTIDGRDKLFLHLDIDEEGLDVISSEGGISNPEAAADS